MDERPLRNASGVLLRGVKKCATCGRHRHVLAFWIVNSRNDGRSLDCVSCVTSTGTPRKPATEVSEAQALEEYSRFERLIGWWVMAGKPTEGRE